MVTLGPLAFAAPLALIGLLTLPLLWLILRATPPSPQEVVFAPMRLLGVETTPEKPESAPWWLIVFRLLAATLIILALARPVWAPNAEADRDAPLLIVIDDGWAGAQLWPAIEREARSRLEAAGADGRRAAVVFSAPRAEPAPALNFASPGAAIERLEARAPAAWGVDRRALRERLREAFEAAGAPGRMETVWISDGLAQGGSIDARLAELLSSRGPLRVLTPPPERAAMALGAARPIADGFEAALLRGDGGVAREAGVVALGEDGRVLSRERAVFGPEDRVTRIEASLPLDLRNRIAVVRLEGVNSAAAVRLLDDGFRHPRLGLIEPAGEETRQPLLSDTFYLREALATRAEVIIGDLDTLLEADLPGLIMVDAARSEDPRLIPYVENGGLLLRFAGPRLAARGDELLPAPLRQGDRLFGGALAWDEPQPLAPFPDGSPFAGLAAPREATVARQVLAQPGPALEARVWARLEDGTPLVTAQQRGAGWIVLFHVTAGPEWSNLPLSGVYPAMLGRIAAFAQGGAPAPEAQGGAWRLERALNGAGVLVDPPPGAEPVAETDWPFLQPGPDHPPGLYRQGAAVRAFNVIALEAVLEPLARNLPGALYETLDGEAGRDLMGPLLTLALLILFADALLAMALAGRLASPARAGAVVLTAGLIGFAEPCARAQDGLDGLDEDSAAAALELRFAYVIRGDARTDALSEAGLSALSGEVFRRSAIEPAAPHGVDIETDPILFYPFLYWPVSEDAPALSPEAAAKVEAYLQSGGMIVFDTQDLGEALARQGGHPGLRRTLDAIDTPPLHPTPADHVLTRSFYLLSEFPGRLGAGPVWVEADPDGSARDGTSAVIIGSADWAGAWALDNQGRPMTIVEGGPYNRELAYRFGVNVAMYALTGNYKADEVHIPAILERLNRL